jgi:hypothetical protein
MRFHLLSLLACVTCDSRTACLVRHGIFHDRFLQTLAFTVAPFPLFLLGAVLVYFRFPLQGTREAL